MEFNGTTHNQPGRCVPDRRQKTLRMLARAKAAYNERKAVKQAQFDIAVTANPLPSYAQRPASGVDDSGSANPANLSTMPSSLLTSRTPQLSKTVHAGESTPVASNNSFSAAPHSWSTSVPLLESAGRVSSSGAESQAPQQAAKKSKKTKNKTKVAATIPTGIVISVPMNTTVVDTIPIFPSMALPALFPISRPAPAETTNSIMTLMPSMVAPMTPMYLPAPLAPLGMYPPMIYASAPPSTLFVSSTATEPHNLGATSSTTLPCTFSPYSASTSSTSIFDNVQ